MDASYTIRSVCLLSRLKRGPRMKLIFSRIVALIWLSAAPAFAQTAQMTGTISDQTGASVPNTTVTVTNVNTGVARSSVTNSSGNYLVTALLPGTYRVTTQAPGFKQMSRDQIVLEVDQIARIDFDLTVGATQETVEVHASAVILNSESSTISALVENRQVVELPLNGRNPIELVALQPGIRVQGNFGGKQ